MPEEEFLVIASRPESTLTATDACSWSGTRIFSTALNLTHESTAIAV